jgi:hypothetical protein
MQIEPRNLPDAVSALGSGCLRWLASNSAALDDIGDKPLIGPALEQQEGRKLKVLGEIALLLTICARTGLRTGSRDYQSLFATFCAAIERLRPPIEHPSSCLLFFLNVTLALEANGRDAGHFRALIARLLRQDLFFLKDQTPWSIVGLTYLLDLYGLDHALPSYDELYSRSILRSRPPIHFLTSHDKYALSHLFFFLSDFGARKKMFLQLPDHDLLSHYLDDVTASCLIEEDWDLLGEFLIGYECIGQSTSEIADYAWSEFLRHQRPSGEIEPPRRLRDSIPAELSQRENFELHYHQTLVGLIASALYLHRHG